MGTVANAIASAVTIALVVYSIILHEIAHAYAAFRLGDPTAKLQGRLSLNPIVHIDPINTIIIPLITYLNAGFIFGGAKPVPVNPLHFRNMRKGMMLTGIAGPLVNLGIMLVFAFVHRVLWLASGVVAERILSIVYRVGLLNMILLIFNMIPIPPLDGSRVLRYFLPREAREAYDRLERFGLLFVLLFFVLFMRQLSVLFYYVALAYDYLARG